MTKSTTVEKLKKELEDAKLLVTQAEVVILQKDLEIGKLKQEILRIQAIEINQQLQQRSVVLQKSGQPVPGQPSPQAPHFVPAGAEPPPLPAPSVKPPRPSVTRARKR